MTKGEPAPKNQEKGMPRYSNISRDALDAEGQVIYDEIAASRGTVRGPFVPLIQVPKLAKQVGDLGAYLRFGGQLPGADRELAICTVGRELGAHYEWYAHAPLAIKEGARPEAIEIIRAQAPLD